MKPFATVEQYERRFGECDDPDLLTEVLMDATRLIASELDRAKIPIDDSDESAADKRMQVCRAVAFRTMGQELDSELPIGATQFSQGIGEYSQSISIGNPYREVYLTQTEKRLLGIAGRSRIGFITPGGGGEHDQGQ